MTERTLLIDTSVRGLALGILDLEQKKIIGKKILTEQSSASHFIGDAIVELCAENATSVGDFNSAICAVGPGSFTGIRIGLSFLYGLTATDSNFKFYSYSLVTEYARLVGKTVCLSSTKDKGFLAHPNGALELVNVDKILNLDHCIVVSPWDHAVGLLQNQKIQFEEISLLEVLTKVWNDFETRKSHFSSEKPVAQYLRQSSAEENR